MNGQNENETADQIAEAAEESQKRERSSIAFPYMDLDAAMEVAKAIHDNVGRGECSLDQIAAWLKQSAKSSGLRLQLATARLFGLIESNGPESHKLTALGNRVVDQNQARKAKAEAFLTIPLYRAVFDKYRGGVLPPAAALERDMASLGVAEKQKGRARNAFQNSAEQAGFFEHGRDRLVEPAVKGEPARTEPEPTGGGGGSGGVGGSSDLDLDPLIIELLRKIPPANEGWPEAKRLRWMRTFAMNVSQIYDDEDEPVEFKIELEKSAS